MFVRIAGQQLMIAPLGFRN